MEPLYIIALKIATTEMTKQSGLYLKIQLAPAIKINQLYVSNPQFFCRLVFVESFQSKQTQPLHHQVQELEEY